MFCLFRWLRTFKMKSASIIKQRQVAKTWSVEDLIAENAPFQVDVRGKREIHMVPWSYMFNLVSNVNTMLDNLHRTTYNFLSNFIVMFCNISCYSQNQKYCFQGPSIFDIHFELGYMSNNKYIYRLFFQANRYFFYIHRFHSMAHYEQASF